MECPICTDEFPEVIKCFKCDNSFCKTCLLTNIRTTENLRCMHCNAEYDREMIHKYLGSKYLAKEYKELREKIVYEREKALLPSTSGAIYHVNAIINLVKELDMVNDRSIDLQNRNCGLLDKVMCEEIIRLGCIISRLRRIADVMVQRMIDEKPEKTNEIQQVYSKILVWKNHVNDQISFNSEERVFCTVLSQLLCYEVDNVTHTMNANNGEPETNYVGQGCSNGFVIQEFANYCLISIKDKKDKVVKDKVVEDKTVKGKTVKDKGDKDKDRDNFTVKKLIHVLGIYELFEHFYDEKLMEEEKQRHVLRFEYENLSFEIAKEVQLLHKIMPVEYIIEAAGKKKISKLNHIKKYLFKGSNDYVADDTYKYSTFEEYMFSRDTTRECRLLDYYRVSLRSLLSNAPAVEEEKFEVKCPLEKCKGFLSKKLKCPICENVVCRDCREIKYNSNDEVKEHECDANILASVKSIKDETKPCPKCRTFIYRISGCNQMWCTVCQTAFSFKTGKIEAGNVHNPHYFEWLRKNRGGDAAPEAHQVDQENDNCDNIVNNILVPSYYMPFYLMYANFEVVRHRTAYDPLRNSDLRYLFTENELSEKEFVHGIQIRDKAEEKHRMLGDVERMFKVVANTIMRKICLHYQTRVFEIEQSQQKPKLLSMPMYAYAISDGFIRLANYEHILQQDAEFATFNKEIIELIKYYNENIVKVAELFSSVDYYLIDIQKMQFVKLAELKAKKSADIEKYAIDFKNYKRFTPEELLQYDAHMNDRYKDFVKYSPGASAEQFVYSSAFNHIYTPINPILIDGEKRDYMGPVSEMQKINLKYIANLNDRNGVYYLKDGYVYEIDKFTNGWDFFLVGDEIVAGRVISVEEDRMRKEQDASYRVFGSSKYINCYPENNLVAAAEVADADANTADARASAALIVDIKLSYAKEPFFKSIFECKHIIGKDSLCGYECLSLSGINCGLQVPKHFNDVIDALEDAKSNVTIYSNYYFNFDFSYGDAVKIGNDSFAKVLDIKLHAYYESENPQKTFVYCEKTKRLDEIVSLKNIFRVVCCKGVKAGSFVDIIDGVFSIIYRADAYKSFYREAKHELCTLSLAKIAKQKQTQPKSKSAKKLISARAVAAPIEERKIKVEILETKFAFINPQ